MLRLTTCLLSVLLLAASSCKERKHVIPQKEIVKQPTEINKTATDIIKEFLANPADTQLSTLKNISFLKTLYGEKHHNPVWTGNGKWNAEADSLYTLINSAQYYGLFPKDYHSRELNDLQKPA